MDMHNMLFWILGVDQNIIQIDYHAHIQQVCKNAVNEVLECSWSVGKSERHNKPFIGAIACAEGSFPFIPWRDVDQMVCVTEVNFGIYGHTTGGIQEVGDEQCHAPNMFGTVNMEHTSGKTINAIDAID